MVQNNVRVAVSDKALQKMKLNPEEVRVAFRELLRQYQLKKITGRRINKRMVEIVHQMGIFIINVKKQMLCKVHSLIGYHRKRLCTRTAKAHVTHSSRHYRNRVAAYA